MKQRLNGGMTLVEMLIAMAILAVVLLVTSSGIIQSLQVNRLAEDAANTQSKLRRISEVVSQELRSAVMGGLTDYPVTSGESSVSFALLSGDGGLPVTDNYLNRTGVFATDPAALQELVGSPALIIESSGRATLIDKISSTDSSDLVHVNCTINYDIPASSRVYAASAIGFSYDADSEILYQHTMNQYGSQRVPFAFGLSRFEIAYEYASDDGDIRVQAEPQHNLATGLPAVVFTDGDGTVLQLARLRLNLASESADDGVAREYVSYIELSGIGSDAISQRTISEFWPCGTPPVAEDPEDSSDDDGSGSGGPGSDPPGPGGPGGPGGPDDPGSGGDDDSGGGDSDDDNDCAKRIFSC